MTKHALAKALANYARPDYYSGVYGADPTLKVRAAKRRRRAWLAKRHKRAIALALVLKAKEQARG